MKPQLLNILMILTLVVNGQISTTDFVFTVKTDNPGSSNNQSYRINVDPNFVYSYDVDWNNDGIFEDSLVTGSITHNYGVAGNYTIRLKGIFPSLKFGDKLDQLVSISSNDKDKLISIDQWGNQRWFNLTYAFHNCDYFLSTPLDTLDLSIATSLDGTFKNAARFNGIVNHWNTSTITSLYETFAGASAFNRPLNNWDVSNVLFLVGTFKAVNQTPSSFNQSLNNWDVSSVRNMSDLFHGAEYFNQPLNSWDVSSVEQMNWMFVNTDRFNQNIDMWDVSSVKSMIWMFGFARSFNQPLNSWVVDSVTNMSNMFTGCNTFNQPLDNWDVSSVTNMIYMFQFTNAFDQSLTSWDFSNLTNLIGFLSNSAYSISHYDSLLMHWNTNHSNLGLTVGVDNLKYCNGAAARNSLIANNWTFINDSLANGCIAVGMNDIVEKSTFSVGPNPAKNLINIYLAKAQLGTYLEIYASDGRLVFQATNLEERTIFDVSEFENGVYFLRLADDVRKLIIKH